MRDNFWRIQICYHSSALYCPSPIFVQITMKNRFSSSETSSNRILVQIDTGLEFDLEFLTIVNIFAEFVDSCKSKAIFLLNIIFPQKFDCRHHSHVFLRKKSIKQGLQLWKLVLWSEISKTVIFAAGVMAYLGTPLSMLEPKL